MSFSQRTSPPSGRKGKLSVCSVPVNTFFQLFSDWSGCRPCPQAGRGNYAFCSPSSTPFFVFGKTFCPGRPQPLRGKVSCYQEGLANPLKARAKATVIKTEGFLETFLGGDLLSHTLPCSIIGDGGLNYRVRNGTGCTPSSLATKKILANRSSEYISK